MVNFSENLRTGFIRQRTGLIRQWTGFIRARIQPVCHSLYFFVFLKTITRNYAFNLVDGRLCVAALLGTFKIMMLVLVLNHRLVITCKTFATEFVSTIFKEFDISFLTIGIVVFVTDSAVKSFQLRIFFDIWIFFGNKIFTEHFLHVNYIYLLLK